MTTLILNRKHKGYYTNRVENIEITVSEFNGSWTGVITDESKIEESEYILFNTYASSKKEVVNQIVRHLTTN